jgi:hypothetical protein
VSDALLPLTRWWIGSGRETAPRVVQLGAVDLIPKGLGTVYRCATLGFPSFSSSTGRVGPTFCYLLASSPCLFCSRDGPNLARRATGNESPVVIPDDPRIPGPRRRALARGKHRDEDQERRASREAHHHLLSSFTAAHAAFCTARHGVVAQPVPLTTECAGRTGRSSRAIRARRNW